MFEGNKSHEKARFWLGGGARGGYYFAACVVENEVALFPALVPFPPERASLVPCSARSSSVISYTKHVENFLR